MMKTLTKTIMAFLWLSISLSACKKGDIGPQGPEGPQGEQGVQGADGKAIFSGSGAPGGAVGAVGDFYIDLQTTALYGPKTNDGWGTAIPLKGETGAKGVNGTNGKDGSNMLSGNGAPAADLGKIGDYYLNKTNTALYGPKTAEGWGTALSLKGEKGDPGNANVSSITFTAANIEWNSTVLFGTNYVTATLAIPEVTQDIVNNGAIMVYGGFFFPEPWTALPISFYEAGKVNNFSYGIAAGKVVLKLHYSNNAAPSKPGIAFRVVILKGNAMVAAKNKNLDLKNYNAVKETFDLQE